MTNEEAFTKATNLWPGNQRVRLTYDSALYVPYHIFLGDRGSGGETWEEAFANADREEVKS